MRYIQTYALFEQIGSNDTKEELDYITNILETTDVGNDLKGIFAFMQRPWYRTTKTGRVYFDGAPGITYIKKSVDGSWRIVQEYHAIVSWSGSGNNLEDLLRILWDKEVSKDFPQGADRKDYIKWIAKGQSILHGKGFTKDQIKNKYLKSIGAENIIRTKSLFFQERTKYRIKLDKLGYSNEKFDDNSPIKTLFDYYEAWKQSSTNLIPLFYFNTLAVPRVTKKQSLSDLTNMSEEFR